MHQIEPRVRHGSTSTNMKVREKAKCKYFFRLMLILHYMAYDKLVKFFYEDLLKKYNDMQTNLFFSFSIFFREQLMK